MTPLVEAHVAVPPRLQATRVRIAAGERVAVIGPNGSGKSTLLKALAGIDQEQRPGTIVMGEVLASATPARRARLLSFLPASREVRWPIPVRDVVAMGLATPDRKHVEELLERLQLSGLSERPVEELSTGERARALLGRALANRPHLLLLDEPLSNLDPAWVLRTLDILDEIATAGTAIVLALHDLVLLERFDRVWMLDHGRLVAELPPAELMASPLFGEVFGVARVGSGWMLNPSADRRSSP